MKLFFDNFKPFFDNSDLEVISSDCIRASFKALENKNGNVPKWNEAIKIINTLSKGEVVLNSPYIQIKVNVVNNNELIIALEKLLPWRKGPFMFNDFKLESEWQGDLKWRRISENIKPLVNKNVLDVGSGNGYFTLRMAMEGAQKALGIDPFLLFNYQFQAIKSLIDSPLEAMILPIRLEDMPKKPIFDSVFSMGVLYHQRDHMNHLNNLKAMMAPGAELILETLVVDGEKGYFLIPNDRYARMRNVHCLPSIKTLKSWLIDANFQNIKVIDINKTSPKEQRRTPWIGKDAASLQDFLDPNNSSYTIEGHPAPTRVIIICNN